MSRTLGNCKRLQADAFEFVIVKYVFGIRSPQLRADSAMKFLKRIIKSAYGLTIGVLVSTWIPSFFPMQANSVCVMHHAPGGNLDSVVTD